MEYQAAFEKLGNQVIGLSPEAILNCFISGLIPQIQNKISIHKPTSISQAIGLAKLIESKIRETKPKFQKPFSTPYSCPTQTQHTPIPTPSPQKQTKHQNCQHDVSQTHSYMSVVLKACEKFLLLLVDEEEVIPQENFVPNDEAL